MNLPGVRPLGFAGVMCFLFALFADAPAWAVAMKLDNAGCLACHDGKKAKIEVPGRNDEKRTLGHVDTRKFGKSVHADMQCVACHTDISDNRAEHVKAKDATPPNCINCHENLWEAAKNQGQTNKKGRLGVVVQNIKDYKSSFHARPDEDNPDKAKATCEECHSSHDFNVPPKGSELHTAWHNGIPDTCGEKCHEDQLEAYASSVHAEEVLDKGSMKGTVCTDCHPAHQVVNTSSEKFKLGNVNTCGSCHKEALKSYTDTYHGQVNRLGGAYTAKCADCHDSHGIRGADDPKSKVHPKNRMKTCTKCHSDTKPGMRDATPGFASFGPHANTYDFKKYPEMYVAAKFMMALLIGVFAFFWLHSCLWYYREWQDRKRGIPHARVDTKGMQLDEELQDFRRFHWGWRIAHLVFALVTMTLVLTGTSALFAESSWAPVVASALGGPKMLGLIHRVAATLFLSIFLIHLIYVMQKLLRSKTFRWFGPDSLIPNGKDFADCWGMFKWFVGKGPRPIFERWTYYEKFDYWAVFWGVNVIGWSGLMLAFPHVTATYLPGWVFNVATLVHGEEAFLAAVFLFTVHFFNNHFRPDKLPPPDVVMFTGTQSLAEFRHDHPAHYQRMIDTGELAKYLVDAPTPQMHTGSVILGLTLIACGLGLLVLVTVGFIGG
jgi:cytochrome b subunit of formate dehydrogenase